MNIGNKEETPPVSLGLLANETAFRQILNAMPDMILVKGAESKIIWANRAFREYYGMSNEELAGIVDAKFNKPDHTAQYVKDDARVFLTGQSLEIPQEPVTRHDGVVHFFHTVKSPIFDDAGKVIMTVGISRDITEKLKTRQALDLERGRAVHSSKMVTLGEMAAGVAHEINTPLAIIHGVSGQVLESLEAEPLDREFVVTSLRKIETTAMRISRIITGLNKFARDSSADEPEVCPVSQLVEDALSFAREKIAWHGIHLEVVPAPPDLRLKCNSTLIAQVLLNLVTNARDAVIDRSEKRIRIEAVEVGDSIEISVSDSGPGVSLANREKIFEPFFTTKPEGKGTGLGLSVSRGIVESHGGRIYLDPRPAPTRFVVRLPKINGLTKS